MNTQESLIEIAHSAGRIILAAHDERARLPTAVERKTAIGDLVTDTDREVETFIVDKIRETFGESAFVGEEGGGNVGLGTTWIVDPIDGTTNFVHGFPWCAVSIARIEQRQPNLAVVHGPFSNETFYASAGRGAYMRSPSIQIDKRLSVSRTLSIDSALISFGLPYDKDRGEEVFELAARLFAQCQDLRRTGSAALDLCAVASGRTDAHVELDLRLWDLAAATLILQEAGGTLIGRSGKEIDWGLARQKHDVICSNGFLLSAVRSVVDF